MLTRDGYPPGVPCWVDTAQPDPEAAAGFYSGLFGWQFEDAYGGGSSAMWRLPGYGDFLETLEPGLRSRQVAAGVPEGFADAIGWMSPMTSDQFADDVPPHWSITFTVDDTAAIANRAAELGGKILTPPVAIGVVTTAVLADPQGAVFSVNTYDPNQ